MEQVASSFQENKLMITDEENKPMISRRKEVQKTNRIQEISAHYVTDDYQVYQHYKKLTTNFTKVVIREQRT